MDNLPSLGIGGLLFIALYLVSLLVLGFIAKKSLKEDTLADFYLAGKGFGFGILFLTLFATQYSGNTFFGFTGATYRNGFSWILCLHFMTGVVAAYLTFALKLYRLSDEKKFLTPCDFIQHRYNNQLLTLLVCFIMIAVLCNFVIAQLIAMGRAVEGLSPIEGINTFEYGVLGLAAIMVIYGSLGGIRAVAWTDAIQGIILFFGFFFLLILMFENFGSLEKATNILIIRDQVTGTNYTKIPETKTLISWGSYIISVGFGVCLYPQAIQRIFASKSEKDLRRSLSVMAFMPIPTMLIAVSAGIFALAYFPGLEGPQTDRAFGLILKEISSKSGLGYVMVIVTLSAVLAAMMSTSDSALLSISSMLTKDIVQRFFKPLETQSNLLKTSKKISWSIIIILVCLCFFLKDNTSLIQLLDRKIDLLVQLVPAFIIGLHCNKMNGQAVLAGIVFGLTVSLVLPFSGFDFVENGKVYGLHAGLIGLIPNTTVALLGSYVPRNKNE